MAPSDANHTGWLSRVSESIIYSKAGSRIANFPPIAYALRRLTRESLIRAGATAVPDQPLFHERIAQGNLQSALKAIVADAVEAFDYAGAMVATYEPDGALPVRAWHACVSEAQVLEWEAQVAALSRNRPLSLTNPDIARVYIKQPEFSTNLSVQAYYARRPVTSPDLYDLFRPVVPESARPVVAGIQEALGVKQVIAVPFFQKVDRETKAQADFVGNLFVLSRSDSLDSMEQRVLEAFGQQAATGIKNAQLYRQVQELYRQAEDRRRAAAIFGKMAFSASTSVHDLKNKIGVVRGFLNGRSDH